MPGLRTFDHDEAKRLRAAGVSRKKVAAMLGTSESAIQWAVDGGSMKGWACVHWRLPPDLKRALERSAKSDGRAVNAQVVKILKEHLDWRWYEEDEDCETIFAHPVARHIRR